MNVATRGIRNAFRNQIRTFSIVIILGLSIGLALAMLVARQAVQDKIETVKSSIGNTITVSPAGARGFQGGGEALKSSDLDAVANIDNVTKITQTLSDRLTSENTNLVSAIEAGTLGNRQAGNSGVSFMGPPPDASNQQSAANTGSTQQIVRTFTPPVILTGINDVSTVSVYGGSNVTFTSGGAIDPTKDEDTAAVGKSLAEKNALQVGSTFTIYGKTIKVVGIYDAGNAFSNAGLIMPLKAVQRLSSQTGSVTTATVTVNSIDNIDATVTAVKKVLGTDTADVVSDQATAQQAVAPLENVKTISFYSLVGAVIAGGIIILLTMIMIVRERRREIGVMKAIGASNVTTVAQFVSEAITLTVLGLIVGLLIGIASAKPITNVLVTNSASSNTQSVQTGPGGGRTAGPRMAGGGMFGGVTNNIQANVGLDIVGYGVAAALAIAIIGSALPAFLISKVRPAEVMRAE
jgi:putative ABC transport system permease protein